MITHLFSLLECYNHYLKVHGSDYQQRQMNQVKERNKGAYEPIPDNDRKH